MKSKIDYSTAINKLSSVQDQMVWIAKHIEDLAPSIEKDAASKFRFWDITDSNCSEQIYAEMCGEIEFNKNILIPCLIEDLNYAQEQEDPDEKYYSILMIYYIIGVFYTHYGMQLEEGEEFEHPFLNIVLNKTDFRDVIAYAAISLPDYCDYSGDTLYTIDPEDRIANFSAAADLLRTEGILNNSLKSITSHSELADFLSTATPKSAFIIECDSSNQKMMYKNLFSKVNDLTNCGLDFSDIELDDDESFINYRINVGEVSGQFAAQCQDNYDSMIITHINEVLNQVTDNELCGFFSNDAMYCFAYLPSKLILKLEDLNLFQRGESGIAT